MKRNKNRAYVLTPEAFFSEQERKTIIKHTKQLAELDLFKGRKTWPTRYMLVDIALYTGLRVAEIAALNIGDIHLTSKDPYLIVQNGKGNKKRTVYFDSRLQKHFKDFLSYKQKTLHQSIEAEAPLFSGQKEKYSPPITLMKSFKQAVFAAGLRKSLSIHSARHTYATFLLRDTKNMRFVQQQLGHTNIGMTSLYASILPEDNGSLANMIQRDED